MHVIISDEGKKKSGWLSMGNTIKKPISKLNFGFLSNRFLFLESQTSGNLGNLTYMFSDFREILEMEHNAPCFPPHVL